MAKFEKVEMSPFWKPEKEGETIEGYVEDIRSIEGEFGANEVCTIGDFTVGISAGLLQLRRMNGEYVKVVYEGIIPLEKGKKLKKFSVLRRIEE
jgi:hypothetical protein